MTQFTITHGQIGRSIHDAPDDSPTDADRIDEVLSRIPRRDLVSALVIMLSAARTAEGEAGRLDDALGKVISRELRATLDGIGAALVEDGIDKVCDLIGSEALDVLEGLA